MSKEQLAALLAKLQHDAGLRAKLKGAGDLDAVVALGKEAGFDVSKADWLRYQAEKTLDLSDADLEGVAAGAAGKGGPTQFGAAQGCWTAKGGPTGCLWAGCKQ
jgi:predicted ribosomally synthesized peptide with nif11-like leader